jgi:hypothetical protein
VSPQVAKIQAEN